MQPAERAAPWAPVAPACAGLCSGFVLAGGKSARMGSDKALLAFGEGTLIGHVAAEVQSAAGSVTLIGRPAGSLAGYIVIPDLYPKIGPLGGIATALQHTESQFNLIAACDMPGVSAAWLSFLLEQARHSEAQCVVPATPEGRLHPLCAVYQKSALPGVQEAIARGVRRVRQALEYLDVALCQVGGTGWLRNVNTPEDWASCQQAMREENAGK